MTRKMMPALVTAAVLALTLAAGALAVTRIGGSTTARLHATDAPSTYDAVYGRISSPKPFCEAGRTVRIMGSSVTPVPGVRSGGTGRWRIETLITRGRVHISIPEKEVTRHGKHYVCKSMSKAINAY